jgi:small subunit ribosomal protein S16
MLKKDDESRVKLNIERCKYWLSVGALPTDRVARFLDTAGLFKHKPSNNPIKGKPGKKRVEREAAAAEKAKEGEETKAAAAEAPAETPAEPAAESGESAA